MGQGGSRGGDGKSAPVVSDDALELLRVFGELDAEVFGSGVFANVGEPFGHDPVRVVVQGGEVVWRR